MQYPHSSSHSVAAAHHTGAFSGAGPQGTAYNHQQQLSSAPQPTYPMTPGATTTASTTKQNDMQRELDLLWIALEEERLVVKMKNDVIGSLQRALADSEGRSRAAVAAATAAATKHHQQYDASPSPASYTTPINPTHQHHKFTVSPSKEVPVVGSSHGAPIGLGLGLSRSSSAPPSEEEALELQQEHEITQRVSAAVDEARLELTIQNAANQIQLITRLETAHRVDVERGFLQQLEFVQQLAVAEGAALSTSMVVDQLSAETVELRALLDEAETDALNAKQEVERVGVENTFFETIAAEAVDALSGMMSSAAPILSAINDSVSFSADQAVEALRATSKRLEETLARERRLAERCGSLLTSFSTQLATDHSSRCQLLLDDATERLQSKQLFSAAIENVETWVSSATTMFDDYCAGKADSSHGAFASLIESTVMATTENNSNVFKQIAAAKARLREESGSADSRSATPRPVDAVKDTSADLVSSSAPVHTQPPPAWRQLEADYVNRIRQLEERHAQKARLLAHSSQRAEELEAQVSSQLQVIEALQKAASATDGPSIFHQQQRQRLAHADSPQSLSRPTTPGASILPVVTPEQLVVATPPSTLETMAQAAQHAPDASGALTNARDLAAQSLREQLRAQTEMLEKLEGADRTESNETHLAFFADACATQHALVAKQLLELSHNAYDTWHLELVDTIRNERRRIAEHKRFEEQNKKLMSTFHIDPNQSDPLSASAPRNSTLVQSGVAVGSGDDSELPSLTSGTTMPNLLGQDFEPSAFAEAVVKGSEINSAAILLVQSLLLQQKREVAMAFAESQSILYDCFINFAPMSKAPETIRVQVAEGALALTEAQRDQALSVAHWLTNECNSACATMRDLLSRTSSLSGTGGGVARKSITSPLSMDDDHVHLKTPTNFGNASNVSSRSASRAPSPSTDALMPVSNESFFMGNASTTTNGILDLAGALNRTPIVPGPNGFPDEMFNAERVHSLCDRLLEGVANMHERLMSAEVELGETRMELQQSVIDTSQYQEAMLNATVAQCVEREISDDALVSLRENLRIERNRAQMSISCLLHENQMRNDDIRDLQLRYSEMSASAHAANLQSAYIFEAFNIQLERNFAHFRTESATERMGMMPSTTETAFLLLMVHSKLGEALVEAVATTVDNFRDFDVMYVEFIRQRERHNEEMRRMAEELVLLQRERRLEKESSRFIEEHIKEGLLEEFLTAEKMNFESFIHVSNELQASVSDRVEAVNEAKRSVALREEMRVKLAEALELAEDRDVALSVANERTQMAQRALEDQKDEVITLSATIKEKEALLEKQQEEHTELTAEQQLFEQLLVAERQAHQIAQQRETSLQTEKEAIKAAMAEMEAQGAELQQLLDREREAHRATIRSFAQHSNNPGGPSPPPTA